jgi:hypothetical protein
MSTAIWPKEKLDRYWLLQQRARALGMRLTGEGQGSPTVHLQTASADGMVDGETFAGTYDDLDAVDQTISGIEEGRAA